MRVEQPIDHHDLFRRWLRITSRSFKSVATPVLAVGIPTGHGAILWTLNAVFTSAPSADTIGCVYPGESEPSEGER